jgi:flagellar biosynthesis/type III secretory pathway M-ring protein FliF/YscJ
MNITNVSITVLAGILFAIIALFVIIRGFRLPKSYHETEAQRAAMRKRVLEQEYAVKEGESGLKSGGQEKPLKN